MPVSARGLPGHCESGNGHCGHLPVEIFLATGRAGIGFIAGGRAKAGMGMPIAHHYILVLFVGNLAAPGFIYPALIFRE